MPRLLVTVAIFCLCGLATVSTTQAVPQQSGQSGHADIVNAQGQKIGTATAHPSDRGVRIEGAVSQLPVYPKNLVAFDF